MSKIPTGFEGRSTTYTVRPKSVLVVRGWNPRIDFGDINELKESIRANGVMMPITVRRNIDGGLDLVDGERRLRACLALEDDGVEISLPAKLETKGTDDAHALVHAMVANQGKPFNPIEEAIAFKRLRDHGMTILDIATAVGRSDIFVGDRLKLIDANVDLKKAVEDGEVPVTLATEIITQTKDDPDAQAELTADAKSGKAGQRKAKAKVAKKKEARKGERLAKGKSQPGAKRQGPKSLTPSELSAELVKVVSDFNALCADAGIADEAAMRSFEQSDDRAYLAYVHGMVRGMMIAQGRRDDELGG